MLFFGLLKRNAKEFIMYIKSWCRHLIPRFQIILYARKEVLLKVCILHSLSHEVKNIMSTQEDTCPRNLKKMSTETQGGKVS